MTAAHPSIITNMAFWQCPDWTRRTDSIYAPLAAADPEFFSAGMEAVRMWRRRSGYEVVLTMGARASLAYGLLCALTGQPSRQIMTEVFIDQPRPAHPLWRLKVWAYRLVARRALGILTNSLIEVETIGERFRVPRRKLRYVPMHSNIKNPRFISKNEGFVLSAGRTLRDYDTLLRAAPRIRAPVVIICGRHDLPGAGAANLQVLREIDRSRYLDYLERCAVVALPLLATERSTGQVVLLEAMALGKAVVTTRSPGTLDYISHQKNGLLVSPGDAEALAREVNALLAQPDLAQRLGRQALADIVKSYTFDAHAQAKLTAIEDLWSGRGVGV